MKKILGEGLLATSIILALKKRGILYEHNYVLNSNDSVVKALSSFRKYPVIGSKKRGGLSKNYHGVTPGVFLKTSLSNILFPNVSFEEWMEDYSFVPRSVPRPLFFAKSGVQQAEIVHDDSLVLACSVIGNLEVSKNYDIKVGDHVIVKLGKINKIDVKTHRVVRRAFGMVFHRHFDTASSRIFLRPDYGQSTSIDFGQSVNGRTKFILNNLSIGKVLEAIYLRFGLVLWPFEEYSIYVQLPVEHAYEYRGSRWKEIEGFREKLMDKLQKEILILSDMFESFKAIPDIERNILTGIHLTYDRRLVEKKMWDTSLSKFPLNHPTLMACAAAYDFFLNE